MGTLERSTAICAVVGGSSWIAAAVYRSTMPRGCIDEECSTLGMRGDTPLGTTLFAVAAALLTLGGLGLLAFIQRRSGLGRLGVVGLASCVTGVALLVIGLVVIATLFPGFADAAMPAFVVPGLVLVAVGVVLVAVVILRSRVLPLWAGLPLLIGAGLLLLANEQTARVLFAVPLGVAWVLVGTAVWQIGVDDAVKSQSTSGY